MILLDVVAKLALAVKSQAALRTFKWVAHSSKMSIWVLLREFFCTCARPRVFGKLSSLGMKMSIQEQYRQKSHPGEFRWVEWVTWINSANLVRVKVPIESQLPVKGGRTELTLEDLLPLALFCFRTFTLNTFLSVCVASHVVNYDLICLCHNLKLG